MRYESKLLNLQIQEEDSLISNPTLTSPKEYMSTKNS